MAGGGNQERPISLFYSYSHTDEELRKQLEHHLAVLRWNGKISEWHDRNIDVGDEWEKEIDRNLSSADIIVLLVSARFLASRYCWSVEITKALERHNKGEARVIPVILSPCAWDTAPFAKLQVAPTGAKPVTSWPDRDEALLDVARKIERVVTDLQQHRRRDAELAQHEGDVGRKPTPHSEESKRRRVKLIAALALIAALELAIVSMFFLHKPSTLEPQRPAETERKEERAPAVVPAPAPAPAEPTTEQPQLHPPETAPKKTDTAPPTALAPGTRALEPGDTFRDCPQCPEVVVVPAGEFLMGAKTGPLTEKPQIKVSVPRRLAVGRYEVTRSDWQQCVNEGACERPIQLASGNGRQPVTNVSWHDAQNYVNWLAHKTGHRYRLLSEAEWEYAARAGTTSRYFTGNVITREQATFGKPDGPSSVGAHAANSFGLFNTYGNVWEWVEDCPSEYSRLGSGSEANRSGDCTLRVLRGGAYDSSAEALRASNRYFQAADARAPSIGFRIARDLDGETEVRRD